MTFNVDDDVMVVNVGATFIGLSKWKGLIGYEHLWGKGEIPTPGQMTKIIKAYPQENKYLIGDERQVYIIDHRGLKLIEPSHNNAYDNAMSIL